jgi:hypothetical protein
LPICSNLLTHNGPFSSTAFDIEKFEDNIRKIATRRDFYSKMGDDSKANALQEAIEMLRMD